MQELRWELYYENFEAAFKKFEAAVLQEQLNELEQNGLIQRFEFTVETAWKTLKSFLEFNGFLPPSSPKEVFKFAAKEGLITSAEPFLNCINLRNQLSHDYSESKFKEGVVTIKNELYTPLSQLNYFFKGHLNG